MKNLAASVLARLAQRRAKTGEDFNVLLVRFCLERLLYRLSRSSHREHFVLKGAMLFALWEPTLHRVTRDLDLLGFGDPTPERSAVVFRELCRADVESDGVEFDANSVKTEEIRARDEYAGIRVTLKAQIGKAIIPLQVDIGFGDALRVAPEEITFPVLLGMAAPKLRAYRRETVIAEKLEAIVKFGMINTRFKDYFDLHFLAHRFSFEGIPLSTAIAGTFECRGTRFPEGPPVGLTAAFATDTTKIRGWESFYRKVMTKDSVPPLLEVVQRLAEFLDPPMTAASKGKVLHASWRRNRWIGK
jgi:predicted nucleotidyltransferase component of viral defense system